MNIEIYSQTYSAGNSSKLYSRGCELSRLSVSGHEYCTDLMQQNKDLQCYSCDTDNCNKSSSLHREIGIILLGYLVIILKTRWMRNMCIVLEFARSIRIIKTDSTNIGFEIFFHVCSWILIKIKSTAEPTSAHKPQCPLSSLSHVLETFLELLMFYVVNEYLMNASLKELKMSSNQSVPALFSDSFIWPS